MRKSPTSKYHSVESWFKDYCKKRNINIPEIDSIANALYAHVNQNYVKIQNPDSKDHPKPENITVDSVIAAAAKIQGIYPYQLTQRTRKREVVDGRKLVSLYLVRRGFSLTSIGEYLGGQDHATVYHAVKTLSDWMDTDSDLRQRYRRLENEVQEDHHIYPPFTRVKIKATGEYGKATESAMGFISVIIGKKPTLKHFMMDEVEFVNSSTYGKDVH